MARAELFLTSDRQSHEAGLVAVRIGGQGWPGESQEWHASPINGNMPYWKGCWRSFGSDDILYLFESIEARS